MEKKEKYITLGQFLKLKDYVSSGGEAKHLIDTFEIYVNGEADNRRGRKLYPGDLVIIEGHEFTITPDNED